MNYSSVSPLQPFERVRRPFHVMGREFHFQFIPSIHFQHILRHTLELLTAAHPVSSNPQEECVAFERMIPPMRRLLEEKIYEILFDVLLYQNDERVDIDTLKHQTTPLEIAQFLHLLLTDGEIVRALGVIADGLGKLLEAFTDAPFPIPNYMHSS